MFLWKWDLKVANNSEKMRNQMQVMLIFMLPKKFGGGGGVAHNHCCVHLSKFLSP